MTKKVKNIKFVPLKNSSPTFGTYDLGCSAALLCAGFEVLSLDKENPYKSLFLFKRTDGIEEIVDSYWANRLEIKARSFFDAIKALKNMLYSK